MPEDTADISWLLLRLLFQRKLSFRILKITGCQITSYHLPLFQLCTSKQRILYLDLYKGVY